MDSMEDRKKLIEKSIESIYAIKSKIVAEMHLYFNVMQITHSQWMVLQIVKKNVKKNVNTSIKDLAGILGITSSATTQIVDGLVSKGFLFRKRNPDDRRVIKVALTEKSSTQIDSLKSKSFNTLSSLFDALDDEELFKYCELSNKITGSISAELHNQKTDKKILAGK
jgi:DNA-binding MarR family transcriptional regulator